MNLMPIVVMVFGIIEGSIQKPNRVIRNFRHGEGRPKNSELEGNRRTRLINFPIIYDNESHHRRSISDSNSGFTFKPLNENETISKDFIATMDKIVNSSRSDATASSISPKQVQKQCDGGARSPHKTTNKPTILPRSFKSDFKAPKSG